MASVTSTGALAPFPIFTLKPFQRAGLWLAVIITAASTPRSRTANDSIGGGALWVTAFLWAGYFFGNLPAVRANFSFVVLGIIVVSVLPIVIVILRERRSKAQ